MPKKRDQKKRFFRLLFHAQFFRYEVLEIYLMVGRAGLEPAEPFGDGFTVRGATNYALPTQIMVDLTRLERATFLLARQMLSQMSYKPE